jgi:6-pyruvoyltetrahydropterin/6-carboxytetrahydropterin synthase
MDAGLTSRPVRVTSPAVLTCSKSFVDIPFAHRAHEHHGHCRLIHGHNWSFDITFAGEPDGNGFVMDFGKLAGLREAFMELFDHRLLINEADPLAEDIVEFLRLHGLDNVTLVADCSSEGIAKLVFNLAATFVGKQTGQRVRVTRVTVSESATNRATYEGTTL